MIFSIKNSQDNNWALKSHLNKRIIEWPLSQHAIQILPSQRGEFRTLGIEECFHSVKNILPRLKVLKSYEVNFNWTELKMCHYIYKI